MNYNELNNYIQRYVEKNKTQFALLLDADWGYGKSFYINNTLIKWLNKSKISCIVVSLYGLTDVKEISRAIYFEMRNFKTKNNNLNKENDEAKEYTKIICKTIFKNSISLLGMDFSIKEDDLNKLYASLDLSNVLLIFEDFERSKIDLKDIFGYLNLLLTKDDAKILLIANEKELIKYDKYYEMKEKLVCDTIKFKCDYVNTINDILKNYQNTKIGEILIEDKTNNIPDKIYCVLKDTKSYNLRSLIFAIQKTADIFSKCQCNIDNNFLENVLLSVVAFTQKYRTYENVEWTEETNPNEYGTYDYPLYKFCFDYIKYQSLNIDEIANANQVFIDRQNFKISNDKAVQALEILYTFYEKEQSKVESALNIINESLKNNVIPLTEYGKLSNYLIAIRPLVDISDIIDSCKKIMKENMKNNGDYKKFSLLDELRFHSSFEFWEESQKQEYREFSQELQNILKYHEVELFKQCESSVEYIRCISKYLFSNDVEIYIKKSFFNKLDMEKIINGLKDVTINDVADFRKAIMCVYDYDEGKKVLENDRDNLMVLKKGIEKLVCSDKISDKILKQQYKWFIQNLESILYIIK